MQGKSLALAPKGSRTASKDESLCGQALDHRKAGGRAPPLAFPFSLPLSLRHLHTPPHATSFVFHFLLPLCSFLCSPFILSFLYQPLDPAFFLSIFSTPLTSTSLHSSLLMSPFRSPFSQSPSFSCRISLNKDQRGAMGSRNPEYGYPPKLKPSAGQVDPPHPFEKSLFLGSPCW